ncbi:MAG: helix-turn-helix domain-containing protein [Anderseniella sp.]
MTSLIQRMQVDHPNQLDGTSGWSVDFRQIEDGLLSTTLAVRPTEKLTLLGIKMDKAVHQRGCSPAQCVTFGIPSVPGIRSWNGTDLDCAAILSFGTAQEYDSISDALHEGLAATVAVSLLEQVSNETQLPFDHFSGAMVQASVGSQAEAVQQLSAYGKCLLDHEQMPFRKAEQKDFLINLLAATSCTNKFADRSDNSKRRLAVLRAIEFIEHHLQDDMSISDVCLEVKTPWRTLDRGFKEYFGFGPNMYRKCLRLNRVRIDILHDQEANTISEIAGKWGFWHMGQFAQDYRKLFNEKPSQTRERVVNN